MKIYTGNFANIKKYRDAGLETISIARFNRYYSGKNYDKLAPDASIIHLEKDKYIPIYRSSVLEKLSIEKVLSDLSLLSGGKDVILLCYEKAGEFCHRRIVAEWIEKNTGKKVNEFCTIKQKELF